MNRIRINIIVKLFFFAVILCFVGHEIIPHHHHDFLSIRSNSCQGHDNNGDDNSCKILNHLSSDKKSISCTIKFDVIKKLVPRDLITASSIQIIENPHLKDLKVFENKQFKDDDQFNYTSRQLRAPPAA